MYIYQDMYALKAKTIELAVAFNIIYLTILKIYSNEFNVANSYGGYFYRISVNNVCSTFC